MSKPNRCEYPFKACEAVQERDALRASLAAAEDKNATLIRDLELACRDLAAVKLSRDAAEAKLAEPCETVCDECLRARRELEAKLADAEKHADELAAELEKCNDRAYRNAQIAAHYCASKGVSESFMGKQSRKYMDTVFVLTAHAARRAGKEEAK